MEQVNSPLPKLVVALPLPGTTPKAVAANDYNINKNYCTRASLSLSPYKGHLTASTRRQRLKNHFHLF